MHPDCMLSSQLCRLVLSGKAEELCDVSPRVIAIGDMLGAGGGVALSAGEEEIGSASMHVMIRSTP